MSRMGQKKRKPQPKNGYYFLMLDFKKQNEEIGIHYSMAECANLVKDRWAEMDQSERDFYVKMADGYKEQEQAMKYNTHGMSFAQAEAEQVEKERDKRIMDEIIASTVKHLDVNSTLQTKLFHLIHINYFCSTENRQYIPAEIALAEFCLQKGITKTMQKFIMPGELPKGYRYAATEHCNSTHKTPIDLKKGDVTLEGALHYTLLQDIKSFIKPDGGTGEFPPLYTMQDNINTNTSMSAVKSVLSDLCDVANEEPMFKVYLLPKLFYELRNAAGQDTVFEYTSLAEGELEKDVFNYTKGIACDFHEDEDVVQFCSLSIVTRWVYLICDHCCKDLNIPLIPGQHCPKMADIQETYRKTLARNVAVPRRPIRNTTGPDSYTEERQSARHKVTEPPRVREPHQSYLSSAMSSYRDSNADSEVGSVASRSSVTSSMEGAVGGVGVDTTASKSIGRGISSVAPKQPANWSRVASMSHDPPPQNDDDNFPAIGQPARPANPWGGRGRGLRGGRTLANFKNLSLGN